MKWCKHTNLTLVIVIFVFKLLSTPSLFVNPVIIIIPVYNHIRKCSSKPDHHNYLSFIKYPKVSIRLIILGQFIHLVHIFGEK